MTECVGVLGRMLTLEWSPRIGSDGLSMMRKTIMLRMTSTAPMHVTKLAKRLKQRRRI
jgi:hypothetical protein